VPRGWVNADFHLADTGVAIALTEQLDQLTVTGQGVVATRRDEDPQRAN
jgi:hypothetical protein